MGTRAPLTRAHPAAYSRANPSAQAPIPMSAHPGTPPHPHPLTARAAAPVLSRSLAAAAEAIGAGTTKPDRIEAIIRSVLDAEPLAEPDLVAVAAADTLEPIDPKAPPPAIALMIAVRIGRTRLIDQRVVAVP